MADERARGSALERFEQQTALPMLILAVAIVPLLAIPLVFDLSSGTEATLIAFDWFIWAAFLIEYGIRLYLAPEKWKFLKANKIDLKQGPLIARMHY